MRNHNRRALRSKLFLKKPLCTEHDGRLNVHQYGLNDAGDTGTALLKEKVQLSYD
jgi:hypothetical protein